MINDIIEEWDKSIKSRFNLHKIKHLPIKSCECTATDILPFDYYLDPDGVLILCAICRYCEGYRELGDASNIYPIQFKVAPSISGMVCDNSGEKRKNKKSIYL